MAGLSGNLLDELVVDILGRNPAKSLTRFNCVSKSWRELIGSTYFLKHQKNQPAISNPSFVFNRPCDPKVIGLRRCHDTHGGCIEIRPPLEELRNMLIYATGDGIIYFRAWFFQYRKRGDFLWNPATRKLKALPQYHRTNSRLLHQEYVGVWFASDSNCVKVVRLQTYVYRRDERKKAEIWSSFDSESWREIDVNVHENLGSHLVGSRPLNIGGTCYWAGGSNSMGERRQYIYVRFLVSFDMVNESFNRISLPGELDTSHERFVMAELKHSVAVVVSVQKENHEVEVWLMNNDDKHYSSWSKYYSVKAQDVSPAAWMLDPLGLCGDTETILCDHENLFLYFHNMITKETISARKPRIMLPLYLYKESLVPV